VFADDEIHDQRCATLDEAVSFLEDGGFTDVQVTARSPRPKHQGQLALLTAFSLTAAGQPIGSRPTVNSFTRARYDATLASLTSS
jgi:hypothetical protein